METKRVITVDKVENYDFTTPLLYFVRVNGSCVKATYNENEALEYAKGLTDQPEKKVTEIFNNGVQNV